MYKLATKYFLQMGILILILGLISTAFAESDMSAIVPEEKHVDVALILSAEKKELTLREAIQLALQRNPELAAFEKEIHALGGITLQAGLVPNPVLQFDQEDVSSRADGPGARFSSIRISQLIELGGKRSARTHAASLGQERAEQDYAIRRLDLIAQVANMFTNVLAGQARLQLALAGQELAQKVVDAATKRVQAGKAPPIEETRAKVVLATANIELNQSQRDLAAVRKQLVLLWGDQTPKFERVLGDLESFVVIPEFNVLDDRIRANPLALSSLRNLEQRKALLTLEKARRIPDVTFNAGVRRYGGAHDTTALVGLSIPLPLFNRNQGNLLAAHQRVDQAMDQWTATDLQLRTLLVQAYEALLAADNEITMLRDEILPGAKQAFTMANRGYELGRFSFLELLDAQRALFQNQTLYLNALSNYQRLVNEIERLIAAPIENAVN